MSISLTKNNTVLNYKTTQAFDNISSVAAEEGENRLTFCTLKFQKFSTGTKF